MKTCIASDQRIPSHKQEVNNRDVVNVIARWYNPFIPSTLNNRLRSYFENSTTNTNSTPQWHHSVFFKTTILFTFQSDHKDLITNIIMFLLSHICACFNGVRVYILKPRLPVFPWVWGQRGDFCILQGKSETQITPKSTTTAKGLPSVILNHILPPKTLFTDFTQFICHMWLQMSETMSARAGASDTYGYVLLPLYCNKPNLWLWVFIWSLRSRSPTSFCLG